MAGLSGVLALFAFGSAVRASPFAAGNGTITQPPTLTTGSPPSATAFSNVTCGTISDFPGIVLQEYVGLATDPALQCQCLKQVNDWLSTSNPATRTEVRTIGTGITTFTETITSTSTVETTVVTTVVNTLITATITGNFIEPESNFWYGTATSPCCYSCTIAASTVEVFYWADPTETSTGVAPVTSFTSNGYTFESPSVYIGFASLSAFDYCGVVGQPFVNITVGFDPGELSTIVFSPTFSTPLTNTITFTDGDIATTTSIETFFAPVGSAALNTKDLERNCSTIAGYSYIPGNPSNAINSSPDPCHPTIVIPDRVRSLDPAWASCIKDGFGGFYDPPSALSPVSALIPTTTQPPATTTTPRPPRTTSSSLPTSTPPPPPPPPKTTTSTPPPPPPPPSSTSKASSTSKPPPPPPPPSSSGSPASDTSKPPPPPPPPSSTSQGGGGKSASSSPPSNPSSSSGGGNSPPPPASSSNGAGSGGSGTSPSNPSGTPGGGNGGGNNGGGNGGGSNGGGSNGGGSNGGGSNGGGNGGNGGSNGSGNGGGSSGSPGNGSGSGSPPNGSNDSGGNSNSGGNGSGSNGSGSNGNGSNGNGSNGNGSNGNGSNGNGSNGNGSNGNGSGGQNGGGATNSPTSPQNTGNGAPPTSIFAVGSATFSENSHSEFVFGSTTLVPGGPAVTLGGTTLSLPTSGSSIIVNGATEPISEAVSATLGSESTAAGETGANGATETGAPGSQETSGSSPRISSSANTASSGLPSPSVPTVPKNEAASGLFSGAMRNVQVVGAVMLIAFYI